MCNDGTVMTTIKDPGKMSGLVHVMIINSLAIKMGLGDMCTNWAIIAQFVLMHGKEQDRSPDGV